MTPESTPRRWTVDDLFGFRNLSDAQISPDGRDVAFVMRDVFKDETARPKSSIYVASTGGAAPRRFTSGPRTDMQPRWSPDGQTLAFLSDREEDGKFGAFLVARDGGEAQRLVELKGSAVAIEWSSDGRQLGVLMQDPPTEEERRREETRDDAIEFERDPKYQRLWVVNADGSGLRPVTTGDVQVWEFAWFPDGQSFALVCSDAPYEWSWYQAGIGIAPYSGGSVSMVYRGDKQVARPLPSPDGSRIAFVAATWSDRGVIGGDLFSVPAEGGETTCLTAGYPASFSWILWQGPDALVAVGYEDGEGAIFRVDGDGPPRKLWSAEAAFADRAWARASIASDGALLAVVREDHGSPPDVWTAAIPRESGGIRWIQITQMQSQVDNLALDAETLRWESLDGIPVQGILVKPFGYEGGKRYPLVTIVHGGPTSLYTHSFIATPLIALLASSGCAVLLPNPRGSTGWGSEFAEANLGDMGGADLLDVLAGIDMVVERGMADRERLGIGGWSYGGFMTAWTVTQTDRFRAAMMGAGIANWRSFHGVSNLPTWDRRYYGSDPYQAGGAFDHFSAVLHVDHVRTPTLILHGEADAYVPVGQAYEFFRALKEHAVEVELVVYPREGHAILERGHMRHMLERAVAWFTDHLAAGA